MAALALAFAGFSASIGSAGVLDPVLAPCSGQAIEQPFTPWLDPAKYVLAPDGGLEAGGAGWSLAGGASVAAGNEAYHVHGAGDSRSLSLPAGASATTPTVCVGLLHPTLRLFTTSSGSALSTLKVDVVFRDLLGLKHVVPVGVVTATATWQPTLPMLVLANLTTLPVVTDGTTPVAFRFTAIGGGGSRLDDVFVDPYKGS